MKNLQQTKTGITYFSLPLLLVLVSSSFAATYYVGTCHSSSYPTISAAVAAVPPNSTVDVCPGTYPEQVFIYQPLTLQGIKSGNNDRARIVVPTLVSQGVPNAWQFVPNPDPGAPTLVAPQIYVSAPTGPVKIDNLTIDASGETAAPACYSPGSWFTTGILYQDSSGTVTEVNTVGQGKNSSCGVGIRATVVAASSVSVTISNNSIQDTNTTAVWVDFNSSSNSLKINVSGNTLVVGALEGISSRGVTGTISSNSIFIERTAEGILDSRGDATGPLTISNNTLYAPASALGSFGIWIDPAPGGVPGRTLTGNRIVGFDTGITLPSDVAVTVKQNAIFNSGRAGIDQECSPAPTLSGNTINNGAIGVNDVPTAFSLAGVSFYNVDQMRLQGICP